jgi:2-polyprenyl-3-methyl-5-hydroxy-6-metoxy-1,4-benzoquinol methylase
MIDLTGKPCGICGSTDSELLWTTTWPEHKYPGDFSMRRCGGCGLLFNSPRLDDAELANLYGRNYYFFQRHDARELPRIVPMYQRTVALVADEIKTKKCLDVGCGRGYLPAVLKGLGWDARGVEISSDAADYGTQRFGLDVFTGTIEQYARDAEREMFPLVTAIDVIEHVPSPETFVAAAAQCVEPGGRLIIDTPNGAARNIDVKGVQWKGFNPFHIYLFTIPALTTLLSRHGLVVERAFSYGNEPAEREPFARRLRDGVARQLKRVGLIRPAVTLYFKLKEFGPAGGETDQVLRRTVAQIRSAPGYPQTDDARARLAQDGRGDNIVVIARKA